MRTMAMVSQDSVSRIRKAVTAESCRLVHHGAAASSTQHSLLYLKQNDILVFASHAIVNLATNDNARSVRQTLRSSSKGSEKRVITCLANAQDYDKEDSSNDIVCGFSNGTVNMWWWQQQGNTFMEEKIVTPTNNNTNSSLTDIAAIQHIPTKTNASSKIIVVTATCTGVTLYSRLLTVNGAYNSKEETNTNNWIQQPVQPTGTAIATVLLKRHHNTILLFTGSAAPRGNRIRVYTCQQHLEPINLWNVSFQGNLLGHQDWITCMDWTFVKPLANTATEAINSNNSYLLATGSHDAKIRLWKFTLNATGSSYSTSMEEIPRDDSKKDLLSESEDEEDTANEYIYDQEEEEARLVIHHNDSHPSSRTAVTLEAILVGHDDIVTSVSWHAESNILLSSSMDRSIFIWSHEEGITNTWIPHARIGSAGGILGASIGSSLLGFVDAKWIYGTTATTIVGHGYGGSLYFWKSSKEEAGEDTSCWKAQPPLTGHFRPVNDLSWEPTNGDFLLTVSSDQTCRLIAQVKYEDDSNSTIWREIGRPQVHGYDIHAVACIGGRHSEDELSYYGRFVSGASEKQLRVFDAPCATLRLLDDILNPLHSNSNRPKLSSQHVQGRRVEKAYLPSLGLTNKAEDDIPISNVDEELNFTSGTTSIADILPRERELGMSTVWPEVYQLFGHPTDLICIASTAKCSKNGDSNHSSILVASSCKARDEEQACIRLWDVNRNTCVCVLKGGHQSTVVALGFSTDEKFLASSGKDRRICLWRQRVVPSITDAEFVYELVAVKSMAHKRIIWDLSWCPQSPFVFATGSRDGFVKIWKVCANTNYEPGCIVDVLIPQFSFEPATKEQTAEPVTAVAFAPKLQNLDCAILAVGLENGQIELWSIPIMTVLDEEADRKIRSCQLLHKVDSLDCHVGAIKKIEWKPTSKETHDHSGSSMQVQFTFATCGEDHGVRIFDLCLSIC